MQLVAAPDLGTKFNVQVARHVESPGGTDSTCGRVHDVHGECLQPNFQPIPGAMFL